MKVVSSTMCSPYILWELIPICWSCSCSKLQWFLWISMWPYQKLIHIFHIEAISMGTPNFLFGLLIDKVCSPCLQLENMSFTIMLSWETQFCAFLHCPAFSTDCELVHQPFRRSHCFLEVVAILVHTNFCFLRLVFRQHWVEQTYRIERKRVHLAIF